MTELLGHDASGAPIYAPEPTVQVPVSMIHALVDTVGSKGMPTDLYLRFEALLSQPTPSAERMVPVTIRDVTPPRKD